VEQVESLIKKGSDAKMTGKIDETEAAKNNNSETARTSYAVVGSWEDVPELTYLVYQGHFDIDYLNP